MKYELVSGTEVNVVSEFDVYDEILEVKRDGKDDQTVTKFVTVTHHLMM